MKERLLGVFPDLSAHIQGRDVLLVFDHAIGDAIKKACEQDSDSEALCLARAAKIVRRDLFKTKCVFDGTFPPDCQSKCVPESLKALVNMILEGPSIKKMDLKDTPSKMACLTISQLLAFNSTKHPSKGNAPAYSRHSRESEYPLSIYVALKIHGETRKRSLIDAFYNMGLCISYDRVLTLSTNIANSVTNRFEQEGVVCPPKLRSNIFTTAGVDNIDHNPSSTTAHDSFHGTAISLVQHHTTSNKGSDRGIPVLIESAQSQKKIAQLPEVYTNVPPAFLQVKEPFAPAVFGPCKPPMSTPEGDEMEYDWLNRMRELFGKETLEKDDFLSWAGFHASRQPRPTHSPAIISLLPMFLENAHSDAMILHSMNVIKSAVQHLNPRQATVITLDQPLYAIAKQIQWNWPASHGEDKFVIMLGGLHIEMAAFKVLGNWLDGSGWASVIADAGVASTGVADSFIKASHLTRTRRAHQITAASLSILQNNAYCKYQEPLENSAEMLGFKDWKDKMSSEHPQFHYWCLVLELELCVLQFVRSLREANFKHYVESLAQLAPWMFSLDHINYARWLSIHIRDMCTLLCKHPAVFQQFSQGAFVVHKSPRVFSSIAMDHAHEQANASVKGDGGAVCLTESPGALLRWSVAGPELARMMQEFEEAIPSVTKEDTRHHEQTPGVQVLFKKDVTSLVSAIEEVGNPFEEDSKDLYALDSKVIMGGHVIQTVKNVVAIGQKQYNTFVEERFEKRTKEVTTVISKNKLPLLSSPIEQKSEKKKTQVAALKDDCALFSRLYIACQSREGNLQEFFKHENHPWPPSLAQADRMREGQKSDLVKCLEKVFAATAESPEVDVAILDGAVVVQMASPGAAKTFQDYADKVFMPYIMKQLQPVQRVDVIWDVYRQDSLKAATRERRGCGTRRRVTPSSQILRNWKSFLRVNENKTELFHFLAKQIESCHVEGKELCSTYEEKVLSSPRWDDMEDCTHEEADTRIIHVSYPYVWIPQSHDKNHRHRCRRSCSFENARH